MKKMLFAAATVLMVALISVLLMEVVLRVVGYSPLFINPLNAFHTGDKHLGWIGVASFTGVHHKKEFDAVVSFNEKGFRKMESRVKPDSDARGVMFLGDSFTWGFGVSQGEVFTDHLQDMLGTRFRVVNLGVSGYGTVQERILLEQQLPIEKPAIVGVMLFSNDFVDNVEGNNRERPYCSVEGNRVVLKNYPVANQIGGLTSKLIRYSYAVSFGAFWWDNLRLLIKNYLPGGVAIAYGDEPDGLKPDMIKVMEHTLGEMKNLCDSKGTRLFVFYVPLAGELEAPLEAHISTVKKICAKLDIDLLIPLEYLKRANDEAGPKGKPLYYKEDAHWTAEGHRLVAVYIGDYIRSLGLR